MKVRRIDFSPDEWLSGTIELLEFDRGVYITVCALIYSRGGRIEETLVFQHCPSHGNAVRASLVRLEKAGKISRNGLEIGQKRSENELETAQKRSEVGRENVSKRWNNNGVTEQSVLPRGNANHQPSTTNHHLARTARGNFNGNGKVSDADILPEAPWPQRIAGFHKNGFWMTAQWGPKPGQPGCQAPDDLLAPS
jgi:hypothetical protein